VRALLSSSLLLLACGGSTAPSATTDAASCTLPDGTYTQHFTLATEAAGCGAMADQTFTIPGRGALGTGNPSGTLAGPDAGGNCSVTMGPSACSVSATCTSTIGGYRQVLMEQSTVDGSSEAGSITIESDNPMSGPRCTWDYTITKS
jgi:hypothetical protein